MRAGTLNLLLLLGALGIGAWTALEVLAPRGGSTPVQVRTPQIGVSLPEAATMNPVPVLAEDLTERPLLWADRRPLPPKVVENAASPEPTPKDLLLTGIVRSPGGDIALFVVDGEVERLRRGQRIGGWRLEAVRAGEVELSKGSQRRIIPLLIDDSPAPVAPRSESGPAVLPGGTAGNGATQPLFNGKAVMERLRERKPARERQNRQRNGS